MVLGVRRVVFFNEVGIGLVVIVYFVVCIEEFVIEGFVGLLEFFIDIVVICMMIFLVIFMIVYILDLG